MSKTNLLSIFFKVISLALGFLVTVLLARFLGASDYGAYAFAYSLASLLMLPFASGLPGLVVRETAKYYDQKQWPLLKGFWRWASMVALVGCFGIAGAFLLLLELTGFQAYNQTVLYWALVLIPSMTLTNIIGAKLRGVSWFVVGQIPELLVRQGSFFLLIVAGYLLLPKLNALQVMYFCVASSLLAFCCALFLLHRAKPSAIKVTNYATFSSKYWWAAIVPIAAISGSQMVNQQTDIMMLGVFRESFEVGAYRVATAASIIVAFGLNAINMVAAPKIVVLYRQDNQLALQQLIAKNLKITIFLALLTFFIFYFYGAGFLSLFFGESYVKAWPALMFLALGQLINCFFGSVIWLLNMTGFESKTMKALLLSASVNIVMNFALVPQYGMVGAAFSTAFSALVTGVGLRFYVLRHLQVEPSLLCLFKTKQLQG